MKKNQHPQPHAGTPQGVAGAGGEGRREVGGVDPELAQPAPPRQIKGQRQQYLRAPDDHVAPAPREARTEDSRDDQRPQRGPEAEEGVQPVEHSSAEVRRAVGVEPRVYCAAAEPREKPQHHHQRPRGRQRKPQERRRCRRRREGEHRADG
jgi:hypothetical protein